MECTDLSDHTADVDCLAGNVDFEGTAADLLATPPDLDDVLAGVQRRVVDLAAAINLVVANVDVRLRWALDGEGEILGLLGPGDAFDAKRALLSCLAARQTWSSRRYLR